MQRLLAVKFFCTNSGMEPVREWIRDFGKEDKRTIGEDIKTVQFDWPLGMPLLRSLGAGLWEIRSHLSNGRAGRILFFIEERQWYWYMPLLKTPDSEIELAKKRQKQFKRDKQELVCQINI